MDKTFFLNAAAEYERQFHCRLCLHDYTGRIAEGLLMTYHLNPFCTEFKRRWKPADSRCQNFDRNEVQKRLTLSPSFFMKQCPRGWIEGVFPIVSDSVLFGCLFAGPFRNPDKRTLPAEWLYSASVDRENCRGRNPLSAPPNDLKRFRAYGELLAAALALLSREKNVPPENDRERIEQFLEQRYHDNIGLDDAAELLNRSPARASNRIQTLFGMGFCALLREYRMNAARRLLTRSCFSVEVIASRCGFRSGAYFHRIFHRVHGMSPLAYREQRHSDRV